MRLSHASRAATLVLLSALLPASPVRASDPPGPKPAGKGKADFSGTWVLNEGLSQNPLEAMHGEGGGEEGFFGGPGGGYPGRGGGGYGGLLGSGPRGGGGRGPEGGLPPEVIEDARRLVITDSGLEVHVRRGSSHERVLYADGRKIKEERAAGVAKIRTKRKGGRGEILIVTTDAPDGRDLIETWELHADPRVLVVRTEVEGRRSFTFKRVYEPEKPAGEAPTPAAPVPSSTPSNSA